MADEWVYRRVEPRQAGLRDLAFVRGELTPIVTMGKYPPTEHPEERPKDCPIRPDWWAIEVGTINGRVWLGQPNKPEKP